MRTPFDAALRALQIEMDELVAAIADTARRRAEAERRHAALVRLVTHERGLSASEWTLPQTIWLDRSRIEIDTLIHRQDAIDIELSALREQAIEQQASLRALEEAAARWIEEAARARDRAEQVQLDDLVAARMVAHGRAARREPA